MKLILITKSYGCKNHPDCVKTNLLHIRFLCHGMNKIDKGR